MPTLPTTGAIANPREQGFDAALDELLLRFATSPELELQIVTAPQQPERIQTQQTSEDFLPEFGQVFSRNDFTGGQGLDFAHRSDLSEIDKTRYWDSKGIDIAPQEPGELAGVKLLKDTEVIDASASTNLHMVALADGTLIYSAGSGVEETTTPIAPTPVFTPKDPHTGTQNIEGLAVLGDEVYAACGTDGIAKRSSVGTWSNLASATNCFGVWGVKGRIIAEDGAGLVQTINLTNGTPTTLITLDSGDRVESVIDAGPVILVATSDGTVYSVADNAGTLEIAGQTRLTRSDVVTAMAWSAGVLALGTWDGIRGRIWLASIGNSQSDFTITDAQLVKELDYQPHAALVARNRIYMAVRESATEVALWRVQLQTSGVSRDLVFTTVGTDVPVGLARTSGRLFLSIAGEGVYREMDTFVQEGYLISPMADFFSPASKTWVGLTIQADSIGAGNTLELYVSTNPDALLAPNSGDWQFVSRILVGDSLGQEIVLSNIEGRYAAVQIKLQTTAASTSSPKLTSYALRAYADSQDFIIQMPVSISDQIERPNRRPFRVPGYGEAIYNALLGYDGAYVNLELYRPALTFLGIVEQIQTPVISQHNRGSRTLYSLVRVRGRIITSGTVTQGETGSLGVELLGVQQLGV